MQKIGTAQADFFREVGGAHEYLCRARAVEYMLAAETVITNAACAAATFIYTLNHKNVTFYF